MALPRTISLRATVKWPASFVGIEGVGIVRSVGGSWTASLDVLGLTINNAVDINNDYVPYFDASVAAHRRATLASMVSGGLSGLEFNTRLAKSANYTLVNADKGKTIALGGATLFTLTINAASGYDSDFIVRIINEDAGRGKRITPNGITSFILWPKQTMHLYNQNNVWIVDRPERFNTDFAAVNTLFVSPVGVDTNDGLVAGAPLRLINTAVDIIQDRWLGPGHIQLAAGTYTESVAVNGSIFGNTTISITGDEVTPSNCIIQVGASTTAVNVQDHAGLSLAGVRLTSTGNGSQAVSSRQFSIVDIQNCELGSFNLGTHLGVVDNAAMSTAGTLRLVGDAVQFGSASDNSFLHVNSTIDIPTGRTYTNFLSASNGALIDGSPTFTGAGAAGSTGVQFIAQSGAKVNITSFAGVGFTAGWSNIGDAKYAGTAAIPYYSFSSLGFNTGAYLVSANVYGISANGTKVLDASTAGVDILGTTTNDAAVAGWVGEYGEANLAIGSATALVTIVPKTVTSLSLPAGDLEVWGQIIFTGAATTTLEAVRASISATTNTEDSDNLNRGYLNSDGGTPFATGDVGVRTGPIRISLAAPTTYFLVGFANFGVSTCSAYGKIAYRRLR